MTKRKSRSSQKSRSSRSSRSSRNNPIDTLLRAATIYEMATQPYEVDYTRYIPPSHLQLLLAANRAKAQRLGYTLEQYRRERPDDYRRLQLSRLRPKSN